uniref:LiaI-LiaF-like transmembrane region domain-containing protein n=1 Tax=Bellilinea caldifistulae TaxID=360411 RepID=A0A7C4PWE7_9CHLR
MRSNRLFWGLILILLGTLFLLQTLGVLSWSVWTYFWPLVLILLGAWILLRPRLATQNSSEVQNLSIPLQAADQASIEFNHGAGRLLVNHGAGPAQLLEGSFVGGVRHSVQPEGSLLRVKLNADPVLTPLDIPWAGEEGLRWDVRLTQTIPLELTFHTGAGENLINLRELNVRKVLLETGASSTQMTLPAQSPFCRVDVRAGAASVVLKVPEGVAGRIHMESGLVGSKIDLQRFPYNGVTYETPGFDVADRRVEIKVEAGMGSIEILSA